MTIRMTVLAGSLKDQAFLLNSDKIRIGRGPGVEFELNEPSISKVHAQVEVLGDQIRIQDLGSRNGIRVGGKPVSKIRMRKGVVHIGKVPIRFEFDSPEVAAAAVPAPVEAPSAEPEPETEAALPQESEIPKVDEIKWDDEDNDDDLGLPPPEDEVKEVGKTGQVIAYVFLSLCLVGILLFAVKDQLFPENQELKKSYQFNFNVNARYHTPQRIFLPYSFAGDRERIYYPSTPQDSSFEGKIAEGSNRIFLITPIEEQESVEEEMLVVPVTGPNGQVQQFTMTIKLHADDTPIKKPEIVVIKPRNVTKMYLKIEEELEKHNRKIGTMKADLKMSIWKNLKLIMDSQKKYEGLYEEIDEVRATRKLFDRSYRDERQERFKAAQNQYRLFTDNNNEKYLKEAIKIMENLMEFTDEVAEPDYYHRYQSFLYDLLTQAKYYRGDKK